MTADEVIEAICAAVGGGSFDWVERYVAPDGVFYGTLGGLEEDVVLHGPAAIMRYFTDVVATWDEWRVQPEGVRRNGDTFVVFWRETSRSRELEIVNETASVLTIRDGQVAEARGYLDRRAALEAAGLE